MTDLGPVPGFTKCNVGPLLGRSARILTCQASKAEHLGFERHSATATKHVYIMASDTDLSHSTQNRYQYQPLDYENVNEL